MSRCLRSVTFAVLSMLCCGVAASAETMRCQSVNGNLNCAGSSGASCQTVNGRTVCVSGHGDVVQSFGKGAAAGSADAGAGVDKDLEDALSEPVVRQRLEQRDAAGHRVLLERDGAGLHVRTDGLSIDRDSSVIAK